MAFLAYKWYFNYLKTNKKGNKSKKYFASINILILLQTFVSTTIDLL